MKVFIFEHICGGGRLHDPLPTGLANQGRAMLDAAVRDFVKANVQVQSSWDSRLPVPKWSGVQTTILRPGDGPEHHPGAKVNATFDRLASETDATLVIAPESNGLLANWTSRLAKLNVTSLGSQPSAIMLCSDKFAFASHLQQHQIPTPPTALCHPGAKTDYPVIIKPRNGAGCEDTFSCGCHRDIQNLEADENWIIQPEIAGTSVSVSLLMHNSTMTTLLAGQQRISRVPGAAMRLQYEGGRIPLTPQLSARALALAKRAATTVEGLRGFVGVDLVLGSDAASDTVIEINPRLTVSYVGLRQLCSSNLAAAMLNPSIPLHWMTRPITFDGNGRIQFEEPHP